MCEVLFWMKLVCFTSKFAQIALDNKLPFQSVKATHFMPRIVLEFFICGGSKWVLDNQINLAKKLDLKHVIWPFSVLDQT